MSIVSTPVTSSDSSFSASGAAAWAAGFTWGGSDASFASAVLTIGGSTAGAGIVVTGGTLTGGSSPLFSGTATLANSATTFILSGFDFIDPAGNTGSAAGSLAVRIRGGTAGTTNIFSVDKVGTLSCGAIQGSGGSGTGIPGITVGNSNTVGWVNGTYIFGNASTGAVTGTHRLHGSGTTEALNFGGDTSSFPSWKRSGATFQARLADDSAYTTVDAKFSAEGTAGVASFGPSAVTSITVKDGIITAIS